VLGWAIAKEPWQLFAAALLSGAGWAAMGAAAVNAIVTPWFVRTRPSALATAYNGASIGGVVFSPLWVTLIRWIDFAPRRGCDRQRDGGRGLDTVLPRVLDDAGRAWPVTRR
jgi:MFS family permease